MRVILIRLLLDSPGSPGQRGLCREFTQGSQGLPTPSPESYWADSASLQLTGSGQAPNDAPLFQDLFSRQKGYLEQELDYRKEALDQAYLVGPEVGLTLWISPLGLRGCFLQAARQVQGTVLCPLHT